MTQEARKVLGRYPVTLEGCFGHQRGCGAVWTGICKPSSPFCRVQAGLEGSPLRKFIRPIVDVRGRRSRLIARSRPRPIFIYKNMWLWLGAVTVSVTDTVTDTVTDAVGLA